MQEHEYKARDKTVQKMSRDGLREENLRNKEEKRITGRDTDTEISRSEKKEELDFSKRRHERLKEEREMEQPEQSSRKPRYSREHADILDDEQDIATDADVEEGLTDDSSENPKSAFRTESIRGQPRGERAYLETVADSRDLRKKKMVRDYAAKERRKEKETSREEKAAKRESARYRETSEVMEDSPDKFHEEIKGKSKRERVLKEQRKKVSRLSFGDEGDGDGTWCRDRYPESGIGSQRCGSHSSTLENARKKRMKMRQWKGHTGRACRGKPCKEIHLHAGTAERAEGRIPEIKRKRPG